MNTPTITTREEIAQAVHMVPGLKPISCDCSECRAMCKTPCIGTPEEMHKLVEAGYGDRLAVTAYAALMPLGIPLLNLLAPLQTARGCTFLTEAGHCELHDKGLKPMEGVLAACSRDPVMSAAIPAHVVLKWKPLQKLFQ